MASPSENGPSAAPTPGGPPGGPRPDEGVRFSPPSRRSLALLALLAVALLHLTSPAAWGDFPGLWAPAAGLGLVLIAWFGPRAGWLIFAAAVLAVVQVAIVGVLATGQVDTAAVGRTTGVGLLGTAEVLAAWWAYRRLGHGARGLTDPRSAVVFVLLAPGATAAVFAASRALMESALLADWDAFPQRLVQFWLSRSLGLLAVAPPLLTAATPWLVRRGIVKPDVMTERQFAHASHAGAEPLTRGDWVELIGLALGAGLMAFLLSVSHGRQELEGWQPWGAPLLLIVWASLRQGLRGGAIAAGVAAALPLCLLGLFPGPAPRYVFLLQGNLLALSGAGLLAAAAAGWVRINETRYRQVVTHIPVVVYSGRLLSGPGDRIVSEVTLVSAASVALLGCPPEQLLGDYRRWLERVHPDDREVVQAALAQLSRQKQPVTCEYRLAPTEPKKEPPSPLPAGRTPTRGGPRWVRDVLAPHFDDEGRLSGWEGVLTDVTEQRALAVDLRRTTSMFHALVANLPAGVFFVQGPAGQPILVNNRARQLLGRREDASAGLDHLSQVYRLFRADGSPYPVEELPVYQALHHGTAAMRDDIVVHRPDGRRVPLVTWAAPVRLGGPPGGSDAAVWVLEDLTALHQAEAARRDTEGRLRTVVETMGEGLVVQDRKGAVVDCNAAACAVFRRPPERLRGASLFASPWAYRREDGSPLPDDEHPVQVVLRTGRPVRNFVLGVRVEAPDGDAVAAEEVRWFLVNAMPLVGGAATAGVVTTFSDVTAYRHAQEVLRSSEEKYRGLVESLPLMVVQSDRDMRVLYTNPAVRAVTGFDLEEIAAPEQWATHVLPDDLPRCYALAVEALACRPGRAEFRFRAKDGAVKTVFALAQPRWQDGAVVGVTTLMVDMTRERQLEQDLQHAQRLDLIGRLSSGIAHDFNNLLTIVLSLTDVAHGNLPPEHPVHGDLQRIAEAGEQAASLAGRLLAFSRQQRSTARRAEVNATARRTLDMLRGALNASVELDVCLGDAEMVAPMDETQLQQVLMNLCLNARDAMPDGGRLRVQTELVARPGGEPWARLSVRDEGCGIRDHDKAHIFDPFFSTKERGTGLGLAVVRQIVEACGGRVEVQSEPGRGSRFDVWLPPRPAAGALVGSPGGEASLAHGI